MARSLARLAAVASLGLVLACTSARSERCMDICQREARCLSEADDGRMLFDENECVAACTALERDVSGRELVEQHGACIADKTAQKAGCVGILACP